MRDQDSDIASITTEIGRVVNARFTPYEPNQNGRVYHVSTPDRHTANAYRNRALVTGVDYCTTADVEQSDNISPQLTMAGDYDGDMRLVSTSINNVLAITKTTIGEVRVDGRLFEPQPDMSPVEASWISVLMAYATMTGWHSYDFKTFIHDHKLDRHFRKEEI